MTREEAIRIIRKMLACTDLTDRANLNADMVSACNLAIKALEQEPFKPMVEIDLYSVIKQKYIERDVLDKIRAEIEFEVDHRTNTLCAEDVFAILDKYEAESEE